jgi:signal peptidase I
LIAIVGALVALAVVGSVGWRMAGGSLFTIATPSMCPDLCVGTLVLDQPVHGPVHVGEVVTFRPPGTGTVYTHRVVRVLADGSFKTAGDALGKVDPWTVPPSNVIGRVVFHVRGLGWLWRFLPWMAAALACIVIGRRSIPGRLRKECDLLAITMLAVLPILLMRPLLRASVISWHLRHGGAVVMTVVNDGLLPAQFRVTGGPGASHLAPGQIVTMVGTTQPGGLVTVRQLASCSRWSVSSPGCCGAGSVHPASGSRRPWHRRRWRRRRHHSGISPSPAAPGGMRHRWRRPRHGRPPANRYGERPCGGDGHAVGRDGCCWR